LANIIHESFVRVPFGGVFRLARIELTAASEQVTVPHLSGTGAGHAVTARGAGDNATITVASIDSNFAITLTGAVGTKNWLITHHTKINRADDVTANA
jgi:hypothetical protein